MFNIEILASVIAVVLLFFLVGSLLRFFKQFLCEIFGYNLELLTFLGAFLSNYFS